MPASSAARSALYALHRRLAVERSILELERDADSAAIFAALAARDEDHLLALPLVHTSKRLWGALVVCSPERVDASSELIPELLALAMSALESARRLVHARHDQERLLLLAEATNDALYDWDFETRDFWWGGGILKMLGGATGFIEKSPRWKQSRIHPDDAERVIASFEEARASKHSMWRSEYRFRREDGSYIQVEERGYFLRTAEGRAYRIIGSLQDVTGLKMLLAREHEARMHAEAASRAKDEFLAMLGHELRNPLAPIVTGVELLRMRTGQGYERELAMLQRQAAHLIRLVDDLLDVSRITHGKIELKRETFELASVLSSAIETARPLIESRNHLLVIDVANRGLVVDGDRARLAQSIANLLTNAAKYTEPGGTITVTAKRAIDQIELTVRDTGIGIAPEMLPHVFDIFVQERQALDRAQGGLGLGLSIVRSLIELHGGSVEVRSLGRGHGSEFTIRIPAGSVRPRTENPAAPEVGTRATGRKIVVVDDNEDAAVVLSMVLEGLGNTTRVAHDAQTALRVIDEFTPDLAVLDIGLPAIDGYELARRLRQRPDNGPRLIALTGYGAASDRERSAKAGFDAHLVKPVEVAQLKSLIEDLAPHP